MQKKPKKKQISELAVTRAIEHYYDPAQTYDWDEVNALIEREFGITCETTSLKTRCYGRLKKLGLPTRKSLLLPMIAPEQFSLPNVSPYHKTPSVSSKPVIGANISNGAVTTAIVPVVPNTPKPQPTSLFEKRFKNNEELDEETKRKFNI